MNEEWLYWLLIRKEVVYIFNSKPTYNCIGMPSNTNHNLSELHLIRFEKKDNNTKQKKHICKLLEQSWKLDYKKITPSIKFFFWISKKNTEIINSYFFLMKMDLNGIDRNVYYVLEFKHKKMNTTLSAMKTTAKQKLTLSILSDSFFAIWKTKLSVCKKTQK